MGDLVEVLGFGGSEPGGGVFVVGAGDRQQGFHPAFRELVEVDQDVHASAAGDGGEQDTGSDHAPTDLR